MIRECNFFLLIPLILDGYMEWLLLS
jgi:hypothetical protein